MTPLVRLTIIAAALLVALSAVAVPVVLWLRPTTEQTGRYTFRDIGSGYGLVFDTATGKGYGVTGADVARAELLGKPLWQFAVERDAKLRASQR